MVSPVMILLPLYIYPNATSWTPVLTSLQTYPNVNFNIIINPASGPGTAALPDTNWIQYITELNTYPNAKLLGYVDSNFAKDAASQAKAIADTTTYAGWGTNNSAIRMAGLFIDDAPNDYSTSHFNFMKALYTAARSHSFYPVVSNPGTIVDTRYYAAADNIVIFEDVYSNFADADVTSLPAAYRGNSSVVVIDYTGTAAAQTTLVNQLVTAGFGGVDVSTVEYFGWSKYWTSFVAAFNAVV
jgi:hypothetical protein